MNNATETVIVSNPFKNQTKLVTRDVNEPGTNQMNLEDVDDFTNVCRTCATATEFIMPIFMGEGLENKIADKIHKYLPIQVLENDVLPQVVCYQCASTLIACEELAQCCMQAETALKTRHTILLAKEKSKAEDAKKIDTKPKRKLETKLCVANIKEILTKTFQIADLDVKNSGLEFVCEKCDSKFARFPTLRSFVEHLQTQHDCECREIAMTEKFIKEYVSIVETLAEEPVTDIESDREVKVVKLQRFHCPFCESSFSSPTRLISHLNQHVEVCVEEGMNCCDTVYYDIKIFVKHLESEHVKHATAKNETNICRSCGFNAYGEDELQDHISKLHVKDVDVHSDKESTKKCDKWQKYIPAVCPECNKTFSNKYNMLIHMKSHSGVVEKYPCDRCSKMYKSKASLKSHQEIAHQGILNFVCSHCGEAFPSRIARDVHNRIHTGDKPYTCKYCDRSYRAKNTLDRHLEIHFNIRNYECYICSKRFRRSTHLKYHLNTHKRKK